MSKKVLVMADYYEPVCEATGPVSSLKTMMVELHDGLDFHLMTRFKGKKIKDAPEGLKSNTWLLREECTAWYNRNNISLLSSFWRCAVTGNYHALYCNSFFSLFYSIFPLLICKFLGKSKFCSIVISPRGELSASALAIKPLRKKIYLLVSRLLRLHSEVKWHVTSDSEKSDLLKNFPEADVNVIPNIVSYCMEDGIDLTSFEGVTKVVYISRIVRIKNLLTAIESLNHVSSSVIFDIYGPIEDSEYWRQCEKQIKVLPHNIACSYKGVLSKQSVREVMSKYQVLLVPSQSENFGHVLVEAMSKGLVLIIGPNTPWSALGENKLGFIVDQNNAFSIAKSINSYLNLEKSEKIVMARNIIEFFKSNARNTNSVNEMALLLNS